MHTTTICVKIINHETGSINCKCYQIINLGCKKYTLKEKASAIKSRIEKFKEMKETPIGQQFMEKAKELASKYRSSGFKLKCYAEKSDKSYCFENKQEYVKMFDMVIKPKHVCKMICLTYSKGSKNTNESKDYSYKKSYRLFCVGEGNFTQKTKGCLFEFECKSNSSAVQNVELESDELTKIEEVAQDTVKNYVDEIAREVETDITKEAEQSQSPSYQDINLSITPSINPNLPASLSYGGAPIFSFGEEENDLRTKLEEQRMEIERLRQKEEDERKKKEYYKAYITDHMRNRA